MAAELRVFSAKQYESASLHAAAKAAGAIVTDPTAVDGRARPTDTTGAEPVLDVVPLDVRLSLETVDLAAGAAAVSVFVNDDVSRPVAERLAEHGVRCLALRCAGFNNVDLEAAAAVGIRVVRVPSYSPNAVAEHTIALILALNRNIHRAYGRVRDGNFSLEGLVGFDLAGKTAGVIGTGQIGAIVARLLWHLRCDVLAADPFRDGHLLDLGVEYTNVDRVLAESQIISLNCPLNDDTWHLIDADAISSMRDGVLLVNTGRGALVDTTAVIEGLKSGRIGAFALDVYEEEASLFFQDRSHEIIDDDVFARLLTFPNVLITAHQAFLTEEALRAIAETTIDNVLTVLAGGECANEVTIGRG